VVHAHLLNLAAVSASRKVGAVARVFTFVRDLWVFFHRSSIRLNVLKAMHSAAGSPDYKLVEPADTRWLSNLLAFDSVLRDLDCILPALNAIHDDDGDAMALGLAMTLKREYTVATLCLVREALGIVGRLSRIVQATNMNLVQLPSVVQAAMEDLRSIGTYASFYKSWPAQWEKISGDVVDPAKVADFHSKVALPYLQHLIDDTSARFNAANVVSAFQIFCPANIPSDESALSEYGDAQLDILLSHYGTEAWAEMCDEDGFVVVGRSAPLVDADECRRDWNSHRRRLETEELHRPQFVSRVVRPWRLAQVLRGAHVSAPRSGDASCWVVQRRTLLFYDEAGEDQTSQQAAPGDTGGTADHCYRGA